MSLYLFLIFLLLYILPQNVIAGSFFFFGDENTNGTGISPASRWSTLFSNAFSQVEVNYGYSLYGWADYDPYTNTPHGKIPTFFQYGVNDYWRVAPVNYYSFIGNAKNDVLFATLPIYKIINPRSLIITGFNDTIYTSWGLCQIGNQGTLNGTTSGKYFVIGLTFKQARIFNFNISINNNITNLSVSSSSFITRISKDRSRYAFIIDTQINNQTYQFSLTSPYNPNYFCVDYFASFDNTPSDLTNVYILPIANHTYPFWNYGSDVNRIYFNSLLQTLSDNLRSTYGLPIFFMNGTGEFPNNTQADSYSLNENGHLLLYNNIYNSYLKRDCANTTTQWGSNCTLCNCVYPFVCSSGINGTGCTLCDTTTFLSQPVNGICQCKFANAYGYYCNNTCNCITPSVCNSGSLGNGSCSCSFPYKLNLNTNNSCICENGYYGAGCIQCVKCGYGGHCNDTINGNGMCVQNSGYQSPYLTMGDSIAYGYGLSNQSLRWGNLLSSWYNITNNNTAIVNAEYIDNPIYDNIKYYNSTIFYQYGMIDHRYQPVTAYDSIMLHVKSDILFSVLPFYCIQNINNTNKVGFRVYAGGGTFWSTGNVIGRYVAISFMYTVGAPLVSVSIFIDGVDIVTISPGGSLVNSQLGQTTAKYLWIWDTNNNINHTVKLFGTSAIPLTYFAGFNYNQIDSNKVYILPISNWCTTCGVNGMYGNSTNKDLFNSMVKTLVNELTGSYNFSISFLENVGNYNTSVLIDGIHPNEIGHQLIFNSIRTIITCGSFLTFRTDINQCDCPDITTQYGSNCTQCVKCGYGGHCDGGISGTGRCIQNSGYQSPYLTMGDSIAYGYGLSNQSLRWSNLLSSWYNITNNNTAIVNAEYIDNPIYDNIKYYNSTIFYQYGMIDHRYQPVTAYDSIMLHVKSDILFSVLPFYCIQNINNTNKVGFRVYAGASNWLTGHIFGRYVAISFMYTIGAPLVSVSIFIDGVDIVTISPSGSLVNSQLGQTTAKYLWIWDTNNNINHTINLWGYFAIPLTYFAGFNYNQIDSNKVWILSISDWCTTCGVSGTYGNLTNMITFNTLLNNVVSDFQTTYGLPVSFADGAGGYGTSILIDGIHPNEIGHSYIFNYMRKLITCGRIYMIQSDHLTCDCPSKLTQWGSNCTLCNCTYPYICNSTINGNGLCSTCNTTTFLSQPVNGICQCKLSNVYGYYCNNTCNCLSPSVCNNGSLGDGSCSCSFPYKLNLNTNNSCICENGYYGSSCIQCPICPYGSSCNDGLNNNGSCLPWNNFQWNGTAFDCLDDLNNNLIYWGPYCDKVCDNCGIGGHCDKGWNGTGICLPNHNFYGSNYTWDCITGYYGDSCDTQCPICPIGSSCGSHYWNNVYTVCEAYDNWVQINSTYFDCIQDYWGSNCTNICNIYPNGLYCDDGYQGTGKCIAMPGFSCTSNCTTTCNTVQCSNTSYYGINCDNLCPTCNIGSHCDWGITGTGFCIANNINITCINDCTTNIPIFDCVNSSAYSQQCNETCQICPHGSTCNSGIYGNGTCLPLPNFTWNGTIFNCNNSLSYGYYCNNTCECNPPSYCDNGIYGDGCLCSDIWFKRELVYGDCVCKDNISYGDFCQGTCNCTLPAICANGVTGDGSCSCTFPYKLDIITNNSCLCENGYYGSYCTQCPICPHGTHCNQGIQGNGECILDIGFTCLDHCGTINTIVDCSNTSYYGYNCDILCPMCNIGSHCNYGIHGNGFCIADSENYKCNQYCSSMTPIFDCVNLLLYNYTCNETCPICPHGSTCNSGIYGNGTCLPWLNFIWNGTTFDCINNNSYGYYCDQTCSTCPYGSHCDNHWYGNGQCVANPNFRYLPNGFFDCYEGYYGLNCTLSCFNCPNGSYCNGGYQGDGTCIPMPGWKEINQTYFDCITGRYSYDCSQICISCSDPRAHCHDGINGNGECICDGILLYNNSVCSCPPNQYGYNCEYNCSICDPYSSCHSGTYGTGECICDGNRVRKYPTSPCDCPVNIWGEQCNYQCNICLNDTICYDGMNGNGTCGCPINQEPIYNAITHEILGCKCIPNHYGIDCSGICLNCTQYDSRMICNDGKTGNGTCLCPNELYLITWMNISTNIPSCLCEVGRSGYNCTLDPICKIPYTREIWSNNTIIDCECPFGWSNTNCSTECPSCFLYDTNSYCDDGKNGSGMCQCRYPYLLDPNDSCNCPVGYYGINCTEQCKSECYTDSYSDCHDGIQGDGTCYCTNSNFIPVYNTTTGKFLGCNCMPNHYGIDCSGICLNCTQYDINSQCFTGISGDGSCKCIGNTYPININGPIISCECLPSYYGMTCSSQCSMNYTAININLKCSDGINGTGNVTCIPPYQPLIDNLYECHCEPGASGQNCNIINQACNDINAIVNEGILGDGICYCSKPGFMAIANINTADVRCDCQPGLYNMNCTGNCTQCYQYHKDMYCNDSLIGTGECMCNSSKNLILNYSAILGHNTCVCQDGYYGDPCIPIPIILPPCPINEVIAFNNSGNITCDCANGFYGINCTFTCPIVSPCESRDINMICNDGRYGTGQCECVNNTYYNNMTNRCECKDGYAGQYCSILCNSCEQILGNYSHCDSGLYGTGMCICNELNMIIDPISGKCNCPKGVYGTTCNNICANFTDSHIICSDGVLGTGELLCDNINFYLINNTCQCIPNHWGSQCYLCPDCNLGDIRVKCNDGLNGTGWCECPSYPNMIMLLNTTTNTHYCSCRDGNSGYDCSEFIILSSSSSSTGINLDSSSTSSSSIELSSSSSWFSTLISSTQEILSSSSELFSSSSSTGINNGLTDSSSSLPDLSSSLPDSSSLPGSSSGLPDSSTGLSDLSSTGLSDSSSTGLPDLSSSLPDLSTGLPDLSSSGSSDSSSTGLSETSSLTSDTILLSSSSSNNITTNETLLNTTDSSNNNMPISKIIGITVGCVGGVAILGSIAYYVYLAKTASGTASESVPLFSSVLPVSGNSERSSRKRNLVRVSKNTDNPNDNDWSIPNQNNYEGENEW